MSRSWRYGLVTRNLSPLTPTSTPIRHSRNGRWIASHRSIPPPSRAVTSRPTTCSPSSKASSNAASDVARIESITAVRSALRTTATATRHYESRGIESLMPIAALGFVAVPVGVLCLVGMAGLGIDTRDDPVRGRLFGDAPGAWPFSLFHVLAGQKSQQCHGLLLGPVELEAEVLGGKDELVGVLHELRDEAVDVVLVLEVARRAPGAEVVFVHIDATGQLGHELSHPADLALQQAYGVLALHGVVEHCRVERPAVALGDDAGLLHHLPHGLEYPLRAI